MLSERESSEFPEDSTNIYKGNMVQRYLLRPKDAMFENLCYSFFI